MADFETRVGWMRAGIRRVRRAGLPYLAVRFRLDDDAVLGLHAAAAAEDEAGLVRPQPEGRRRQLGFHDRIHRDMQPVVTKLEK